MIEEIARLLDEYYVWLKDRTSLREVADWVEITTPYLDPHNDFIQIYARRENGSYVLTDDGSTLGELRLSGCSLDPPKRQGLLRLTLNGFGIDLKDEALEVRATRENFPQKKHNLVQAMLAVHDLFYLSKPYVESFFVEDVQLWLERHDIRYTPNVKFTGRTGFDHKFHFVVPKSRSKPERIIQAVSRPDKNSAMNFVLSWVDTREARPAESQAFAILNDTDQRVSSEIVGALKAYAVTPVKWAERESVIADLAA